MTENASGAANQQVTVSQWEIGWLGGVMDSEGWVTLLRGVRKNRNRVQYIPCFGVCNSDPIMIRKIVSLLNAHGVLYNIQHNRKTGLGNKRKSQIQIIGLKRCEAAIEIFLPYLISKRKQMEMVQEFITRRRSLPAKQPYGAQEHALYRRLRISHGRRAPQRSHATDSLNAVKI